MIRIELLTADNFNPNSLDNYQRKQDVKRVYRKKNGEYVLVNCEYTEDWDLEKKRSVAEDISGNDFITYLAFENGKLAGFIGLKKEPVNSYMILDLMQVSAEFRGKGIGKALFEAGKQAAQRAGASALYISACSLEETIAFYRAMGAELTDSPIKEIAEAEPFDLQMVCKV